VTPAELRAHADRLVADWPELTADQHDRLAALLRPALRAA
jgi:hypothetical protein